MMRPHLARAHRRQHGARAQKRAGEIDAQHLLPFLERNLVERPHLQRRENRRHC